jgi:hypothetical protein
LSVRSSDHPLLGKPGTRSLGGASRSR